MAIRCSKCKKEKDETQFYRTQSRTGFHHTCIPCCKNRWKDYVERPDSPRKLKGRKRYIEPLTKICTGCKQEKDIEQFSKRSERANGRRPKCKDCNAILHKKWASKNPSSSRIRNLKSKYGLSAEDYSMLLQSQGGGCAICRRTKDPVKKSLHVDHDHQTGKVRGVLCSLCNKGLGFFADNLKLLRNAADYLERN